MKFFNIEGRSDCIFQFYIGGRRIGKSYSALTMLNSRARENISHALDFPYMYLRLTDIEMRECADTEGDLNPYKSINTNEHTDIRFEKIAEKTYQVRDYEDYEQKIYTRLAIAKSLVSFGNLRGADFSNINEIVFDEFIPSEKVRKTPEIKKAGWLFNNMYETVNSNRELFGQPPVKVYFLANSFSLDSDILANFGLIKVIQGMLKRSQKRYTDRERSIYVELCEAPEIAELKSKTALYKALGKDSKFTEFAIANQFHDEGLYMVLHSVELSHYKPLLTYENITIYVSNDSTHYYAREGAQDAPYMLKESERALFIKLFYTRYKCALLDNAMKFDSISTKLLIDSALDKKGIIY